MTKNIKRPILLLFIFILISSCIVGCSKIFKRSQDKSNEESQNEKKAPPKILISMEEDTNMIIEQIQQVKDQRANMERQQQIEKMQGTKEKKEQQEKEQQGEKQKQEESNQQESEGSGKEQEKQGEQTSGDEQQKQGEEQSQQQKKGDQQPPKVDWSSVEKTIEKLHTSWNNYEVQAQKDGASQNLRENYALQLDTLTNWVMSHNEDETLKAANELYQYYSKFYNLYKHQAPPDIKDITYNVRWIIIYAQEGNWDESDERLQNISKSWEIAKSRMEKPDKELNQKIDAAIEDFARVTREQNYMLVKLKGNVLLKNLEQIK